MSDTTDFDALDELLRASGSGERVWLLDHLPAGHGLPTLPTWDGPDAPLATFTTEHIRSWHDDVHAAEDCDHEHPTRSPGMEK